MDEREIYTLLLEVHQANIQILKNQLHLMEILAVEHDKLIEETNNVLQLITPH